MEIRRDLYPSPMNYKSADVARRADPDVEPAARAEDNFPSTVAPECLQGDHDAWKFLTTWLAGSARLASHDAELPPDRSNRNALVILVLALPVEARRSRRAGNDGAPRPPTSR